jgi:hypothetical protein
MKNVTYLEKEQLHNLSFFKHDILPDKEDQVQRLNSLSRARSLGNLFRSKVTIVFMTNSGLLQQVETTVWSMSDEFVLLKGGTFIPVKAILALEL